MPEMQISKYTVLRQQPPIALLVTFGREMIATNGGLRSFIKMFHRCMASEDWTWLHKCKNRPQHEVAYVYIIVENRIRYRVNFVGYETRPEHITKATGEVRLIEWPRIVLAGPIVKAPRPIPQRGFQGFRYLPEILF